MELSIKNLVKVDENQIKCITATLDEYKIIFKGSESAIICIILQDKITKIYCYKTTQKIEKFFSISNNYNSIVAGLSDAVLSNKFLMKIDEPNKVAYLDIFCSNNTLDFKLHKVQEIYQDDTEHMLSLISRKLNLSENSLNALSNQRGSYGNKLSEIERDIKKAYDIISKPKPQPKAEVVENISLKYNPNLYHIVDRSNVIKTRAELNLLCNWISFNRLIQLELIYKGKSHNFSSEYFHCYFDDSVPTITLVETIRGNRFGGFTSQIWKGEQTYRKDKEAFLFNLDKRVRYNIRPECVDKAIMCKSKCTVYFGDCDLVISDQSKNYESFSNFPVCYGGKDVNSNELTNGEKKFAMKEIEIFQIYYKK